MRRIPRLLILGLGLLPGLAWADDDPRLEEPEGPYCVVDHRHHKGIKDLPGSLEVGKTLMRSKPVPADRAAYFSPIDTDPLSDQYPRKGWWMYIKATRPIEGGIEAEVVVRLRFAKAIGPGSPFIGHYFIERWALQGGELHYLGGRPGPTYYQDPPHISLRRRG
jgi:hypothetical protein